MESTPCYGTYLANKASCWEDVYCQCCGKSFEDLEFNDNCWEDSKTFTCLQCKEENGEL